MTVPGPAPGGTGLRHFIVLTANALPHDHPVGGFTSSEAAERYVTFWTLLEAGEYRIAQLPAATSDIAALIRGELEGLARKKHGDAAVDTYLKEVEGIGRVDIDELARKLVAIGDDVSALAESVGLPDPGAASTEDLVREMWARVHASDAALGVNVNESRALGCHT